MNKTRQGKGTVRKFTEEIRSGRADPHEFRIEFRGTSDVVIEGCLGVISYSESSISLNLGRRIVTFSGAELAIESFFDGFITIIGTVAAAEFST